MASLSDIPAGFVNGIETSSLSVKIIVGALLVIALYNALELIILIFLNFKQYRGLYFWSLLVSSVFGVVPTTIGASLYFYLIDPLWLALTISHIGFYAMVPIQSLVLYSRLYLVLHDEKRLRYVLYLIVADTIALLPSPSITMFGSAYFQNHQWNKAYQITERLQVTGFCVQGFLISSLYIMEAIKLLQVSLEISTRGKNVMYQLVANNVVIITMDVDLLVLEYLGLYYLQVSLKSIVYSVSVEARICCLGKTHYDHKPTWAGN
ncbi:hypothetical protein N7533_009910 [Penicillium manginii]|jgi:hypothetical protein|uniref:uncharacterized protein n=1 Tax=Penicillium manginii TaxID=203109 RepID=UPI0025469EBD|nr:uncharacterized protein N7533_009910 [Penicillium manginii]KAJ5745040.1 hypothetical protein N7533_009910 [Penicillium manginii]